MNSDCASETLDPRSLSAFLAFLAPDREEAGRRYLELRQRLIELYRWRACDAPEELADETLDRVAKKVAAGLEIKESDPFRYVCGVANRVFKETLRQQKRRLSILEHESVRVKEQQRHAVQTQALNTPCSRAAEQARLDCLAQCLQNQPAEERQLILRYYTGERRVKIDNRKRLADELGLRLTGLRMRASRLRAKLESCTRDCVDRE